jgi:AcrR family transcriptional regulator
MPKVIRDNELFDATVQVFAERGFAAATTREIARRAGVNEVTLFRRFGNKAALITAALADQLARSPFARLEVTGDLEADLLALVQAYADTAQAYGGAVLTLLSDVPRYPELRDAMGVLLPNLRRASEVIAAHQSRGELRPGDPFALLVILIAPLMATGLWARTGVAAPVAPIDPHAVVTAFLDGHRKG